MRVTAFLAVRRHIWTSLLRCTGILGFREDSWDSWFEYISWFFVSFVVKNYSWFSWCE